MNNIANNSIYSIFQMNNDINLSGENMVLFQFLEVSKSGKKVIFLEEASFISVQCFSMGTEQMCNFAAQRWKI